MTRNVSYQLGMTFPGFIYVTIPFNHRLYSGALLFHIGGSARCGLPDRLLILQCRKNKRRIILQYSTHPPLARARPPRIVVP